MGRWYCCRAQGSASVSCKNGIGRAMWDSVFCVLSIKAHHTITWRKNLGFKQNKKTREIVERWYCCKAQGSALRGCKTVLLEASSVFINRKILLPKNPANVGFCGCCFRQKLTSPQRREESW